jgi:alkaline phosphatase D
MAFPWVVTWDDHEVQNNYANGISEDVGTDPHVFLQRRANAYQAYYEHMPLRRTSLPLGSHMLLYRRLTFGDLVVFNVLDTRQYRSDQPCDDEFKPRCAGAFDPHATMTGLAQEQWLQKGLINSQAKWNVLAQQTMLAQFDFFADSLLGPGAQGFNMDQWDGYVAARNRLLAFLQQRGPANLIVITGDIHSSWVHDLKADFDDPSSATLGTEFVGTSITSDFPTDALAAVQLALADNPHTRFFDGAHRGYVRCALDRHQWRADFRIVPTVKGQVLVEEAPASTLTSFVVEDEQPGALSL